MSVEESSGPEVRHAIKPSNNVFGVNSGKVSTVDIRS